MYNTRIRPRLSDAEKTRQVSVERLERWLFNILLSIALIRGVGLGIFRYKIEGQFMNTLQILFILISLVLIVNALRYPRLWETNKFYFLQSLWLYALVPFVPAAFLLQIAIHGVEYVMLSDVALQRSALKLNWKWITFAVTFLVVFSITKAGDTRLFPESKVLVKGNIAYAIIVLASISDMLHYYLDGIMFRFQDPAVRANIAPLFAPAERG